MTHHYAISETFGIEAPGHLTIEGLDDGTHPRIPPIKDYVFRREALRDVLAFLECPEGDGLFVTGPTGSGKTSLLVQVAARLKWPMHAVTCHGHMELSDLIGQFTHGVIILWIANVIDLAIRNAIFIVDDAHQGINTIVYISKCALLCATIH